jgi:ATP-dependent Lhr-like helicase
LDEALAALEQSRRVLLIPISGEKRYIAAEDAARYRDALGVPLPQGLPEAFTEPVANPTLELVRRYARTHGPFTIQELLLRLSLPRSAAENELKKLQSEGKLLEGEFRPGGIHREWCDAEVLRAIRRKSLARLRKEVEPVEQQVFARMLTHWEGLLHPRSGLDALLDAIENLQGAALPASILENEILSARVREYSPADLDTLIAAGEVVWCGVESLGERDGRIVLFLADHLAQLWRVRDPATSDLSDREQRIIDVLQAKGALFFAAIHEAAGGGYPGETQQAIWDLVWKGLITSDTFHALRSFTYKEPSRKRQAGDGAAPGSLAISARGFRSRRTDSLMGQGRWSLVSSRVSGQVSATQFAAATAQQLLVRYGVLTREAAMAENLPGGFSTVYPVLKEMEESGRVRRGLFIAGLGATQFAMPAALDLVRSLRDTPERSEVVHLAATDPANPYGTVLRWPTLETEEANVAESTTERMLARAVGASVILVNGALTAYLRRRNPEVLVFLPSDEPERSAVTRALAENLAQIALALQKQKKGLLIGSINGVSAGRHFMASFLEKAGFVPTAMGFQMRRTDRVLTAESLPAPDQQPA